MQSCRETGWVSLVVTAVLCHPSTGSSVGLEFPWAFFCSLNSREVAEVVLHPGAES